MNSEIQPAGPQPEPAHYSVPWKAIDNWIGVLLLVLGKDYGTRRLRARSLRWFMKEVAPRLRLLSPDA